MKKILFFLFAIISGFLINAQSVTITQPNGGEVLYGCQTYQVKWNASGVSNNWNIDYSLNSGAIWTSVSTNLTITPVVSVYTYNLDGTDGWFNNRIGSCARLQRYNKTGCEQRGVHNSVAHCYYIA